MNTEQGQNAVDSQRPEGRRHAGMIPALVIIVAAISLAGYMIPSGFDADNAMVPEQPDMISSEVETVTLAEYARYDADSIDSRVQAEVMGALTLYLDEGPAAFDMITPEKPLGADTTYPFVLDAETLETVAHGAFPDSSGVLTDTLTRADRPADSILADLEL